MVRRNDDKFTLNFEFVKVKNSPHTPETATQHKSNEYHILAKRANEKCDKKFLSAASCFCQSYVEFWNRDDGSGRQRWVIQEVEGGYTIKAAGGRDARAYLAMNKLGGAPFLWAENDFTGKQIWRFEDCNAEEKPDIPDDSDDGVYWY